MEFDNVPIDLNKQIDLMKKYVIFDDKEKIVNLLDYAGYFRISRYGKYLLSKSEVIGRKPKDLLLVDVYNFDVDLRKLLFEYCKYAEIQLRKNISDIISLRSNDPCFYLNKDNYNENASQNNANKRKKRKEYFNNIFFNSIINNEKAIRENQNKYPELNDYRDSGIRYSQKLPAWVYFYYIEFGNICLMYRYLKLDYKKDILDEFYTNKKHSKKDTENFITWIDAIKNLRNICSHHNIIIGSTSSVVNIDNNDETLLLNNTDLFSRIYALKKVLPDKRKDELKIKLCEILKKYPIDYFSIGILPNDWELKYDNISDL